MVLQLATYDDIVCDLAKQELSRYQRQSTSGKQTELFHISRPPLFFCFFFFFLPQRLIRKHLLLAVNKDNELVPMFLNLLCCACFSWLQEALEQILFDRFVCVKKEKKREKRPAAVKNKFIFFSAAGLCEDI